MKNEAQIVQEEMRKLIARSCITVPVSGSSYYRFHRSLLKFFFGVADVTINYDLCAMTLWHSENIGRGDVYELSEVKGRKISYTSLEETLKGCLESGEQQTHFYRSMLFHYNHVSEPCDNEQRSA